MKCDIIANAKSLKGHRFQKVWTNYSSFPEYTRINKQYKHPFKPTKFKVQAHAIRLGNEQYGDWTYFARLLMHFGVNYDTLFAGIDSKEQLDNLNRAKQMVTNFFDLMSRQSYGVYIRFPIEDYLKYVRPQRGNSYLDFETLSNRRFAGVKDSDMVSQFGNIVRVDYDGKTTNLVSVLNGKTKIVESYNIQGLEQISIFEIRSRLMKIDNTKQPFGSTISIAKTEESITIVEPLKDKEPASETDFDKMYALIDDIKELDIKIKAKKSELKSIHNKVSNEVLQIKNFINSR